MSDIVLWLLVGLVFVVSLALSGYFSGMETGLYCVNRLRVQVEAHGKKRNYMRVHRLLLDGEGAVATALIGTNVSNYIATACMSFACVRLLGLSDRQTEAYTVLILTPTVFVFGEMVPKNLFQIHSDKLMPGMSGLLYATNELLRRAGVLWLVKLLLTVITKPLGIESASLSVHGPKRRMALLIKEVLTGDDMAEEQSELVDRVITASDKPLHEIMIRRDDVVLIQASADRRELMNLVRRGVPSHLPVWDQQPRRIIGVIKVDAALRSTDWHVVRDMVRSVSYFHARNTLASALTTLQHKRHVLGIVIDRGGLMLGIVTRKDLIEEIVGELPTA